MTRLWNVDRPALFTGTVAHLNKQTGWRLVNRAASKSHGANHMCLSSIFLQTMFKRPVLKALNLKGALYPGRRRAE